MLARALVVLLLVSGCRTASPPVPCVRAITWPAISAEPKPNPQSNLSGTLSIRVMRPDGEVVPGVTMMMTFDGGATSRTNVTQLNGIATYTPIPRNLPKLKLSLWHGDTMVFVLGEMRLPAEDTWIDVTLDEDCGRTARRNWRRERDSNPR